MASPEAIKFLEAIYARIDKQVRDIVASMLTPTTIAAQDDGAVIANDHRILNFQGPGVVVSDDPALRRANVFIPGAPTSSGSATYVSQTTGTKALSLWNGSSNDAPPSGWETVGFNDSAWPSAVVATESGFPTISGTSPIWRTTTPANDLEQVLTRYTFTLTVTSVATATLQIEADDRLLAVYLNGIGLSVSSAIRPPAQTLTVSPSILVASGTNVLAIQSQNAPV